MKSIVSLLCAFFVFLVIVSARPNAPSTSQDVVGNGAQSEPFISTTYRYRQTKDLPINERYLKNGIPETYNDDSDQTKWLPLSSSPEKKMRIKNMLVSVKVNDSLLHILEQISTKSVHLDTLGRQRNTTKSGSITPNALEINIIAPKETLNFKQKYTNKSQSINENPFEKKQILQIQNNLAENSIENYLSKIKDDPSNLIIHPKFPNTSTNKYLSSSYNQPWGDSSHNNQFIIVEDVDPSLLPKPPHPPQPPWYETWNDSSELHNSLHGNNQPIQSNTPSSVFHSEVTYFPPDPEEESLAPIPDYFFIPRPEQNVTSDPQTSFKPDSISLPEYNPQYPMEGTKPSNPIYNDPVFVEPNTPIFITPVSITNIQNNPLTPIVATNGNPAPAIVVLEELSTIGAADLSNLGAADSVHSVPDSSVSTQLTGNMTSGDIGTVSEGIETVAEGGTAVSSAATALTTSISGGFVGTVTNSSFACNNIQVNNFNGQPELNRQGIQCPDNVNINVNPASIDEQFNDPVAPAEVSVPGQAEDDGGIIIGSSSLFEYFSSIFGAFNVLHPIGFAFWALMFAPLSVLVTSGLGAVAFFFPWLFPRMWLGKSLSRSLADDTDNVLYNLRKKLKYHVENLEKRILTIDSNGKPNLKKLSQNMKKFHVQPRLKH